MLVLFSHLYIHQFSCVDSRSVLRSAQRTHILVTFRTRNVGRFKDVAMLISAQQLYLLKNRVPLQLLILVA